MNIKTYGELMDIANTRSNDRLKTLLRASFQKWCRKNHAMPMDPDAVSHWRSAYISEEEAGELIMAAFGI